MLEKSVRIAPGNAMPLELEHGGRELQNVRVCLSLANRWLKDKVYPSGQYIRQLHATLFQGVEEYSQKGTSPLMPGDYRRDDVTVVGLPDNLFARGTDVAPLMQDYSRALDDILANSPSGPLGHAQEIIHNAAWAYYVFIRIHPFLDGNGRVGRTILSRVLKGAGFKDIIYKTGATDTFKSQMHEDFARKRQGGSATHLNAMNQVHNSGNLASLELYLAENLLNRYDRSESSSLYRELEQLMVAKRDECRFQRLPYSLGDIWPRFRQIDILGGDVGQEYYTQGNDIYS